mmetsp:Transcript_13775/g.32417  ORF Transcript_13775/g.32417 Transcript_13775/m.32417 type:complete len:206 (-) Transcript_13775:2816-3433(-)
MTAPLGFWYTNFPSNSPTTWYTPLMASMPAPHTSIPDSSVVSKWAFRSSSSGTNLAQFVCTAVSKAGNPTEFGSWTRPSRLSSSIFTHSSCRCSSAAARASARRVGGHDTAGSNTCTVESCPRAAAKDNAVTPTSDEAFATQSGSACIFSSSSTAPVMPCSAASMTSVPPCVPGSFMSILAKPCSERPRIAFRSFCRRNARRRPK